MGYTRSRGKITHDERTAVATDRCALALAIEIKTLAKIYSQVLAIGEAETLTDLEMDVVPEIISSYGVQDE